MVLCVDAVLLERYAESDEASDLNEEETFSEGELTVLGQLADLYRSSNNIKECEILLDLTLAGRTKILGAEHIDTLVTTYNLGAVLHDQHRLDEAKVFYERAVAGREKNLGAEHPDTLAALNDLGDLLLDQGGFMEAKAIWERVLRGYMNIFGAEDPKILRTLMAIWRCQLEENMVECEKTLGAEHPRTLAALDDLGAFLYLKQGKLEEAKVLFNRTLILREKKLGAKHPDTLKTANTLRIILVEQDKLDEARILYDRYNIVSEKEQREQETTLNEVNREPTLSATYPDTFNDAHIHEHILAMFTCASESNESGLDCYNSMPMNYNCETASVKDYTFVCDLCKKDGQGSRYKCKECKFNAHCLCLYPF